MNDEFDQMLEDLGSSHVQFEKTMGAKYDEALKIITIKINEQVDARTKSSKTDAEFDPIQVIIFTMQLFNEQFRIFSARATEIGLA